MVRTRARKSGADDARHEVDAERDDEAAASATRMSTPRGIAGTARLAGTSPDGAPGTGSPGSPALGTSAAAHACHVTTGADGGRHPVGVMPTARAHRSMKASGAGHDSATNREESHVDCDDGPIGPVDLAVIGFRGELRQGGIRDAVARAVDQGAVRVLDVLLVRKDDDGSVRMYDAESPEGAEELLGFPTVMPDLVGEEDALAIAAEMDPGTTVLVIAWENVWASEIAAEVRELDGQLLVMERLPREDIEVALSGHRVERGGVMRGRRGRPGLLGVAARTAVVAGTATAVSGKVAQGQQAKAQQAADAEAHGSSRRPRPWLPRRRRPRPRLLLRSRGRRRAGLPRTPGGTARAGHPHRRGAGAAEGPHPGRLIRMWGPPTVTSTAAP